MPGPMTHRNQWYAWTRRSKQLLKETRVPVPARPGSVAKQDYEYERAGTCNLFMSVEPKGQRRHVQVTARRTKVDFVRFVGQLVEQLYAGAKKLHLVLDNLNTHFAPSFEEVLGPEAAVVYWPFHLVLLEQLLH